MSIHDSIPETATATRPGYCTGACTAAPWTERYVDGKLVGMTRGAYTRGAVRKCEHGRIWHCDGQYSTHSFVVSGFWSRLSPVWNPFLYRHAARLLQEAPRGT